MTVPSRDDATQPRGARYAIADDLEQNTPDTPRRALSASQRPRLTPRAMALIGVLLTVLTTCGALWGLRTLMPPSYDAARLQLASINDDGTIKITVATSALAVASGQGSCILREPTGREAARTDQGDGSTAWRTPTPGTYRLICSENKHKTIPSQAYLGSAEDILDVDFAANRCLGIAIPAGMAVVGLGLTALFYRRTADTPKPARCA